MLVLFGCFCLSGANVLAKEDALVAPGKERVDPLAMEILLSMAETLADAEQLSVTFRSSYDAPQEDGQMVEFGALRKIQVKRPDSMRVDFMSSDGEERTTLFDGHQFVIQNLTEKVYSKVPYEGTLDEAIRYLVNDLQITLPLARMFRTTLPEEIKQLVEEVDYVEQDVLTAVPSHHLAVRMRDIDFQVWVGQGDNPTPLRVVITYKHAPGAPQFRADFDAWNLADKSAGGAFEFTPPEDAEELPLLTRKAQDAGAPGQAGGVQ